MAVNVEELAGSPNYIYDRKGGSGERSVKIAWDDQFLFLIELFPDSYVDGQQVVVPPAATFPGMPWLYAKSARVEPFDNEAPLGNNIFPAEYRHARVTISYATEEFDQKTTDPHGEGPGGSQGSTGGTVGGDMGQAQTMISHKISIGGEFLTWPSSALQWDRAADATIDENDPLARSQKQTGVSEDSQSSVIIPLIEHEITWHYVALPPWFAMRTCVGRVNAYAFAGCPMETMLFLGGECSREISNQGARAWTMSYKFAEKNMNALDPVHPQGWNYFLRPSGLGPCTFQRLKKRTSPQTTLNYLSSESTLAQNITALNQTNVVVAHKKGFPPAGALTIKIDAEEMLVTDQVIDLPNKLVSFTVTRRINGTAGVVHGAGTKVQVGARLAAADLTMHVTAGVNFPANGIFYVKVDSEIIKVNSSNRSSNLWELGGRGQNGTVAAVHANGTVVEQHFSTTLSANASATQTLIYVVDRSGFPIAQQFFVRVGTEVMAVSSVGDFTPGVGPTVGVFSVLRGVGGSTIAAHSAGEEVTLVPNGVYDLADFRLLFLSGLTVG